MTPPIYRFFIRIGEEGERVPVSPVWKADASLDYQKENGQQFFRRTLNGKMDFVGADFALIMSASYDDTLWFFIEISVNMGRGWTDYWQGTFSRTDCTINYDDKRITVQPEVEDVYKAVLDNIGREYNLVDLAPQTERIMITKRPLLQLYVPGDTKVSCFIGGNAWEEDADETTSTNNLRNKYKFYLNTILKEIQVTSEGAIARAEGTYAGRVEYIRDNQHYEGTLPQQNGGRYSLRIEQNTYSFIEGHYEATDVWLIDNDDTQLYYNQFIRDRFETKDFYLNPVSGSGMTGRIKCSMVSRNVWARLLCDSTTSSFGNTSKIPSDDIVANNRNYLRCVGYTETGMAQTSNTYSTEPTKWGKRDDRYYFMPPPGLSENDCVPIAQSTWRYASYWHILQRNTAEYDNEARHTYWLRDAYQLASCIQVLLRAMGTDITHSATSAYSQFLYSASNPVSGDVWQLYITQKSNILKGEYTEPAYKAVTSLDTILKMLANTFNAYWFIDSSNRLRIEHISWFKNGGTYSGDARVVGYDLTKILNSRNRKPWCYGQSEVSYDKFEMPAEYTYSWMDDTTTAFNGFPINIKSPVAQTDKKEEINIADFTADIDYMLLCPDECSQDGFALMAATHGNALINTDNDGIYGSQGRYGYLDNYSEPLYKVNTDFIGKSGTLRLACYGNGQAVIQFFDIDKNPVETPYGYVEEGVTSVGISAIPEGAEYFGFKMLSGTLLFYVQYILNEEEWMLPVLCTSPPITGENYWNQNGYLTMLQLQYKYLTYDLPSYNIEVNGQTTQAKGMMRKAKHNVTFPTDAVDIDTNKLIKTSVGFGEINTISLNLTNRTIKATLNYDNDI